MADKAIKLTLDAVERLNKMFFAERVVYLGGSIAALCLLVYAAVRVISSEGFGLESAGLMFGSGGLFAVTGARAIYLLTRTYNLVEDLMRHLSGLQPRRDG